jgi:uncharacterized protein
MTQGYLTAEEGAFLLHLARRTITEALQLPPSEAEPQTAEQGLIGREPMPTERLLAPGAAFVTLHVHGDMLRGCIGSLIGYRPLIEDVRENARAAAFEDPRFPPLHAEELPDLVIEVSVLTEPEPLEYDDDEDLVRKLRPGIDGVIIESGRHRATFLPQVWDQLPLIEEFLDHLCYKAGLSAQAWREHTLQVSIYQAQKFQEIT